MAERRDWDSEKIKSAVRDKRVANGYKFNRQLRIDEQRVFLDEDKVPVDALAKSTFLAAKRLDALPQPSKCLVCGKDISLSEGLVVQVDSTTNQFRTICNHCYEIVVGNNSESKEEEVAEVTTEASTNVAAVATPPDDGVAAAMKTIMAALAAPKTPPAPPIDEAKIMAEACARAREAAKEIMRESVKDFLNETPSHSSEHTSATAKAEEVNLPSAKNDGVEAAEKASGWAAKAPAPAVDAVKKLTAFLSEFSYFRKGVSIRLINTFAKAKNKKDVLESYCEVSQMEDLSDLVAKMKSAEFTQVCDLFSKFNPSPVNKRFAVFYGSPGGGKTYASIAACEHINNGDCETMLCSPSMDASDMLYAYRFDYKSGKRGYVPTALLKAMLAGRAVVLDEINLLPMEARMFLQNILDNKSKVSVMGVELPIKEGFFVIGTMNLETGLGASPLPLPLADRACVIKEFKTTAAQAAVGAGLC